MPTTPDTADGTAATVPVATAPAATAPAATAPAEPRSVADLHRAGQLLAQYPKVRALLAPLGGPELLTAGQLLSRLDPDEVRAAHPAVPQVTVAVTGHGTLSQLTAPLTAELARHGLLARIAVSDFDSYVFDLSDARSDLYGAEPDLVLCVLDPMAVFDEVPVPWRPEDVERVAAEKYAIVAGLVARFEAASRGTLVLNTLPLPHRFTAQLVDHRSRARLGALWREFNARLLRLADAHPGLVTIDLDPLLAEGIEAVDTRLSLYAKAHLAPGLLARYAREVGHLARHLTGRTRKTLAVDLDGTLWGGVLGDDGAEGIEVADGYRGAAFTAFQQVVKQLGSQGVLLAAVSKNDIEPVGEVFRDHPGMTLREDDLVRITANWRPKHDNLAELAEALNLGIDSFVFVDDSPYECGLVRHALPDVAVVQVGQEPARHIDALLADGWFDTRELTAEDRSRVAKYRDELVRKDFLDSFDSLDDYLRQLDVRVALAAVAEADVARVAQLTQRTNQFNLTTRRLTPADVRALAADRGGLALAIRSSDRFGDNGLVGAVLGHRAGKALHIDNFLLSCRVFSRGIEQACLAAVLRHARDTGATEVLGSYRPTPKNHKVKDFYPRGGFAQAPDARAEDGTAVFRHDLAGIAAPPDHIHLTASFGESTS
ncbi:HAD-superfamily phosphatase, subfamily IIIC:FkbH [Streptomyces sulfonofaciens]|uniref:HAD-superfamily phosphatase, subfamily IIIC:FkbH n=1 Tax=Streptomyces sulfonofaciens TaxID=68272 RepID=A0A919GQC0_9ACTN|nr:HAD-IIIC family phosphatase [Streptomyces sulfonofaciens]GHH88409.1 HAD-superfamily phosphatase, subfamily IIIC:FkbH [Streptomyces sulfonofaciens]